MQMKNKVKSERGMMTTYVVITVLTFTIILTTIFVTSTAIRKNQLRTLVEIKRIYEKDNNRKQTLYAELKNSNYVQDSIALYCEATNNIGGVHSNTTKTWRNLRGNNGGILINMNTDEGGSWGTNYLSFSGENDYVSIPHSSAIAPSSFTIELVLNREEILNSKKSTILSKWVGYKIELNTDNTISFGINDNDSYCTSTKAITLGEDCNIAVTYENKTQKIYINSELVGQKAITSDYSYSAVNLTIGTYDTDYPFKGKIYAIRMYNRCLSEEEILRNYNVDKQKYNI